jgi:hypothetical protein
LATGMSMDYLGSQGFVLGLTITLAIYIVLVVSVRQTAHPRAANAG